MQETCKEKIKFEATLRGHALRFESTWGIFSPKKIDEGTAALLPQIELPDNAEVLDLGCGYGAIGVTLGKEANVLMVDKDFVAVEFANLNAKANQSKAKAILSNGFSHVPKGKRFDVIISNIPAKVGKEMLNIILDDAHTHLKPGGRFYMVTIAGLREFMKRNLKERFGNYKKLKEVKGYACCHAVCTD